MPDDTLRWFSFFQLAGPFYRGFFIFTQPVTVSDKWWKLCPAVLQCNFGGLPECPFTHARTEGLKGSATAFKGVTHYFSASFKNFHQISSKQHVRVCN